MSDSENDQERDPVDSLFALRAELEQMAMLIPEFTHLARAWYDAFKVEQFTDAQALYLTAVELVRRPGEAP